MSIVSAKASAVGTETAASPVVAARRKVPGRIVAVGDLHGDLKAAIGAFKLAKVLDATRKWIGGNSVVVQTGDVLDRGDEERALLEWLNKVAERAHALGGELLRLNGNHEVMNVGGNLRYVSASGFSDFAAELTSPVPPALASVPERARGRMMAFLPGGSWAKRLSQFPVVLIVNDTVFAHGGVRPSHVDYGIDRMNAEIAAWMKGDAALPQALSGDDSPFWIRDYGDDVSEASCTALDVVLKRLSATRLVVGHTPQKHGISFACGGKVARIDVGLSSYYGNRAPTVLEIQGGKVTVLDGAGASP
ncbi:MAG: metallophosphoesterase [Polyangiaceae bacterium]